MRVLVVTGSSGGHIFPAVALVQELTHSEAQLLLALPRGTIFDPLEIAPVQVKYLPAVNLSLKLNKKNLLGLYAFFCCAWESFKLILKFKPEVVVGFGSLNTLPLVFWAWFFRIKTIIHEQNVICGRANRLLSKLVDKVAISFSATGCGLNIAPDKIVLTGNPLRREMQLLDKRRAREFFNFKEEGFTVLVTGGSQGAQRLNAVCFEVFSAYPQKERLQVIHICGRRDLGDLKEKYAASGLRYQLFDFFPRMQYAYSASDLVICRAGATTIAELQKFKIPAILVPYPFAYAHQAANARVLEAFKAALVIDEQELTAERLSVEFARMPDDPQRLAQMRRGYPCQEQPDAAKLLAKEVLSAHLM